MSISTVPVTSGTPITEPAAVDEGDLSSPYAPTELLTALRDDPTGIGDAKPRLWWQVPVTPTAGGHQLSYQIQLTRSAEGFHKGAPVEVTPEISSSQSAAVPWPFEPLTPRQVAFWRVRIRIGEFGGPSVLSKWSKPQRVLVGPLSPRDWDNASGIWTADGAQVRPADPGPTKVTDGTFTVHFKTGKHGAGFLFRITPDCQDGYLWRFDTTADKLHKVHVRNGHETPMESVDLPNTTDLSDYATLTINFEGTHATTFLNDELIDSCDDIEKGGASCGFMTTQEEELFVTEATIVELNETQSTFHQQYDADAAVPPFACIRDNAMAIEPGHFGLLGDVLPGDYWALLRTEFDLPAGAITGAFLYATGRSPIGARQHVYRVWVNGGYAGLGPTRDIGRRAYETHDVTGLIKPGQTNAIAFLAWTQTGGRVQALLDVHYADGHVETVVTGPDWTGRPGRDYLPWVGDMNVKVNYYVAPRENIDARKEPLGWKSPFYTGSGFKPVVDRGVITNLHADDSNGIVRVAHKSASVTQLSPGTWLFDTGQERVYAVHAALVASRRQANMTLRLRMSEELNEDGTAMFNLRSGIRYEDTWTLREGSQELEHWGYRCFRYLEIDTDPSIDLTHAITFLVDTVPEPDQTAEFESSDQDLNDVWQLCANSMIENRNDLYMDTPTRERMPYEGDLITRGRGEVVYSHSYDLLRKSCRYLVRNPGKFTEYKFMPVTMAWEEYLETGDADALAEDWALYEREQGLRWFNADGLIEKDRKTPQNDDIIDWPQPAEIDGFTFTRVNTVVNAWQYSALEKLWHSAEAVGRTDDARSFRQLANRLRAALNEQTWDDDKGAYTDGRDTDHTAIHSTIYAASLGIANDRQLQRIGEWLATHYDLVTEIPVSCNAAAWLIDALYKTGSDQLALDVMRSHSETSWWSMMHRWGATQTMEAWSPVIKPNTTQAHPWGASPIVSIARWLLGIKLVEAGASSIEVAPHPANLRHVRGDVLTIRGKVSVDINQSDITTISVTVPGNTSGVFSWPIQDRSLSSVDVAFPSHSSAQSLKPMTSNDILQVPLVPGTTTVTIH